jgi:hypothetical protein
MAVFLGKSSAQPPSTDVQDIVKAKRFALVDDEGDCRATLGFGPGVMVHGQSQAGYEQAVFTLSAKKTGHAVELRVMHDGTPAIRLLGTDGKARVAMRLLGDDSPVAWFIDDKGVDRLKISVESNGDPKVILRDGSGNETVFNP